MKTNVKSKFIAIIEGLLFLLFFYACAKNDTKDIKPAANNSPVSAALVSPYFSHLQSPTPPDVEGSSYLYIGAYIHPNEGNDTTVIFDVPVQIWSFQYDTVHYTQFGETIYSDMYFTKDSTITLVHGESASPAKERHRLIKADADSMIIVTDGPGGYARIMFVANSTEVLLNTFKGKGKGRSLPLPVPALPLSSIGVKSAIF